MRMQVLVTGGAGYIGSHTVLELIAAGHSPIILDDFSNSDLEIIARLEGITGQKIKYYEGDYQDKALLAKIFSDSKVDAVIHFAASKAVAESVEQPLKYYSNNVTGFVELLDSIQSAGIKNLVFSSSAAVYGSPPSDKVTEGTDCHPVSPYGWSKLMDEIILTDFCAAYPGLAASSLRYFNVVGAHDSGKLGESPKGKPQNLLPIIIDAVLAGETVTVFGDDYPTADGSCERDYVHVVDLAQAHVAALDKNSSAEPGNRIYNIGTGKATSVLELIKTFEKQNAVKVSYEIGPRRAGDPAAYYAVVKKAKSELGWSAKKTVEDSVADAWRWRSKPA